MNYSLENFIDFCDEMQIAEEGLFKSIRKRRELRRQEKEKHNNPISDIEEKQENIPSIGDVYWIGSDIDSIRNDAIKEMKLVRKNEKHIVETYMKNVESMYDDDDLFNEIFKDKKINYFIIKQSKDSSIFDVVACIGNPDRELNVIVKNGRLI